MSDDSLATPINKLPTVSTRDTPKPSGDDVSYADILKQQEMERHQFDQQQAGVTDMTPMQPQFQDPSSGISPAMQSGSQPGMMPPAMQSMYQPDTYQSGYQSGYQQGFPAQPIRGDETAQPPESKKKWWRIWLLENKTGWIVALVTFIVLTFVYPRIRGMTRFAGIPLPYWATGGMSVLGAAMVTAIDVSI